MLTPIAELYAAALRGDSCNASTIGNILHFTKSGLLDVMAAARMAASSAGVRSFTCGIINAKSGLCGENCAFCAQSAHFQTNTKTYALLDEDTVLRRAETLAGSGTDYMGIVVSGGSPEDGDFEAICKMANRIRRRVDIRLCASLGILDEGKARAVGNAGFTRYHHNLETSRSHYPTICTSHAYDVREQTVRHAKAAGLRVCSGGIFGLGETWEHRLELSTALAKLDVDSIPINFLTPIDGTPLGKSEILSPGEALSIISVFRLMHPGRDLVVCGGRERSLREFMPLLFSAGANGVMVGDYLTTEGSSIDRDRDILRTLGLS